ncbi:MAG: hypothetical protein ACI9W2_000450 [Gammaproteobacteria bacterium]|jgi:hypothetical protein
MKSIATLGVDLAKDVFHLHGVDARGLAAMTKPRKGHGFAGPSFSTLQAHRGYGNTFFIDEVTVKIQGQIQYFWRAVNQPRNSRHTRTGAQR